MHGGERATVVNVIHGRASDPTKNEKTFNF